MADLNLKMPSLDPLEPVREAQPPTNNSKTSGPPRTPSTSLGGSAVIEWENGVPLYYGAQDVRLKQATPAGDRLRQQQEMLHLQTGAVTTPEEPHQEDQGVFFIPLCYM